MPHTTDANLIYSASFKIAHCVTFVCVYVCVCVCVCVYVCGFTHVRVRFDKLSIELVKQMASLFSHRTWQVVTTGKLILHKMQMLYVFSHTEYTALCSGYWTLTAPLAGNQPSFRGAALF